MVDKISDSKKLTPATKMDKILAIEKRNHDNICRVRDDVPGLYEVLSGGLGKAKFSINEAQK